MNDATVYISPDKITGVKPEYRVQETIKLSGIHQELNMMKNQAYVINPDTIEVYEVDVFDSMGVF